MNLKGTGRLLTIVVIALLLVMVVLGFNNRIMAMRDLSEEAERLEAELEAMQRTKLVLETQIAYATSDAQVEQWAYEEGRMVRDAEGDHLIVPLPDATATPWLGQESPKVEAGDVENWQVWLALFFDQDLP